MAIRTATLANVASSASSVTIFSASDTAEQRIVHNDSSAILYLKFGATASATSYTVKLAAAEHYTFPLGKGGHIYTGRVDGIWASANGFARTTQAS